MPSKVELKQQVSDLTQKLREATNTIQMSGKMVEVPLTKEGKAVEPEHKGNPIACATELKKIESDIAAGKTYWDITEEQYDRWARGGNTCLSCERNYTETKSALTGVGIGYSGVIHLKDLNIAEIAASVREQTEKELFIARQQIKELEVSCGIKFKRVLSNITAMKPLAYVGRWDAFMEKRKQLLIDFELDIKDTIPDIEVRIPTYEVPRVVVVPEYEEIKAGLTEEARARLEEKEKEEKRAGHIPAKWAAYKCPYCEQRFATIGEMRVHASKHKPHACPYCKESFWTLQERVDHIWLKHQKKIKMPVEEGV